MNNVAKLMNNVAKLMNNVAKLTSKEKHALAASLSHLELSFLQRKHRMTPQASMLGSRVWGRVSDPPSKITNYRVS